MSWHFAFFAFMINIFKKINKKAIPRVGGYRFEKLDDKIRCLFENMTLSQAVFSFTLN